jgi:hypothetical protein
LHILDRQQKFSAKNMNLKIIFPWFEKCPSSAAVFSILLAGVFFIAGCGKKPAASTQIQAAPTVDNSQTATMAPATVPSTTGEPAAPDLSPLTQALHIYMFQHHSLPRTFADLVEAENIKNLPALPPGKQFEIDPQTTQVILVNQ